MKKMLFIVFVFINLSCLAHSGRTDKNGGHYNRKTGEYHYHNRGKNKGNGIPVWMLLFGGYVGYLILKPKDKSEL
ncbi:MAG: YHYH domain-containing protein [Bacteroidetes bacterium]|nr:YHYH domain-containing protein [Bacteroidota bacterium]